MDRLAGKASLARAADVGSFARPPMRQETRAIGWSRQMAAPRRWP